MCVSCIWFFFVTFCLKLFLKKKNWSFCYGINNSFRGSALLNSPSVRLSFRPPDISCPMHIFFPLLHLVQPGSYFTNRVPLVKNMQLFWMDLEPCFFVWGYSVNYMKHSCLYIGPFWLILTDCLWSKGCAVTLNDIYRLRL